MVHDRQRQMGPSIVARLREQIASPHPVAPHRPGNSVLQSPSQMQNLIPVLPAGVRHIRLADGHLSLVSPSSIEMMGNHPAPRLRHEGFEVNDFRLDPLGFRLSKDSATWGNWPSIARPLSSPWWVQPVFQPPPESHAYRVQLCQPMSISVLLHEQGIARR